MNDMSNKRFQGGGSVVDEADLFEDGDGGSALAGGGASALADELIDTGEGAAAAEGAVNATLGNQSTVGNSDNDFGLTGVE